MVEVPHLPDGPSWGAIVTGYSEFSKLQLPLLQSVMGRGESASWSYCGSKVTYYAWRCFVN